MRVLTLQDDEADNLETLIDALLIDPQSKALEDGKIRRILRRISMKLHWSRGGHVDGRSIDEISGERLAA